MEQEPKVVYKKTQNSEQIEFEQRDIISPIKERMPKAISGRVHTLKLPQYITFSISEDKLLTIYIQEQNRIDKPEILNATCQNMQSDNAAFEGWAICLKAWLSEKIEKVKLQWDEPTFTEKDLYKAEWCHYNRFLFRCYKFMQAYDWFSIDSKNLKAIEDFQRRYNNLLINSSNKEGDKKSNDENAVEYEFVDPQRPDVKNKLTNWYMVDHLHHQLHVGVKANGKQLFTGRQSAIDIWGYDKDSLTIVELKYISNEKSAKNIKVGIISELFLYASIMEDLSQGIISPEKDIQIPYEIDFFSELNTFRTIRAEMLSNEYHPLIECPSVFKLLNKRQKTSKLVTKFGRSTYEYIKGSYNLRNITRND